MFLFLHPCSGYSGIRSSCCGTGSADIGQFLTLVFFSNFSGIKTSCISIIIVIFLDILISRWNTSDQLKPDNINHVIGYFRLLLQVVQEFILGIYDAEATAAVNQNLSDISRLKDPRSKDAYQRYDFVFIKMR